MNKFYYFRSLYNYLLQVVKIKLIEKFLKIQFIYHLKYIDNTSGMIRLKTKLSNLSKKLYRLIKVKLEMISSFV
jgi:hypothetical protein